MNRRTVLAGVGSIGLLSIAGCLDTVGLAEHTSAAIGVESDTRSETGYDQTGVEELTIEEEVGVGYTEEIVVRNHLTEHEKSIDMGPLGDQRGAVFIVLTTPQISIAGRQVNPVEDKSTDELVELVADNYDGIANVDHDSDEEITVLEESTTVSTFSADAEFSGQDVEVNLHVTEAVATEDDLVVCIGVYPQDLESRERENVLDLIRAISEDVDVDGEGGDESEDDSSDGEDAGDSDDEGNGSDDGDEDDEEDDDSLI